MNVRVALLSTTQSPISDATVKIEAACDKTDKTGISNAMCP